MSHLYSSLGLGEWVRLVLHRLLPKYKILIVYFRGSKKKKKDSTSVLSLLLAVLKP